MGEALLGEGLSQPQTAQEAPSPSLSSRAGSQVRPMGKETAGPAGPRVAAPSPPWAWLQQGVPRGRSGGDSLGLWK